MQVTIGIKDVAQGVQIDVDSTTEELTELVNSALTSGQTLLLKGSDGKTVIVPAPALGYVAIDGTEQRRVGFGFV